MKQVVFVAALFSALIFSQAANAQGRGINQRQFNQKERIDQGRHNGSLDKREAMRLRMQQAKIRHYKQMARADGRVNKKERRFIYNAQMRAGRNIYQMKHNGRFAQNGKFGHKKYGRGNGQGQRYGGNGGGGYNNNYQSWDKGNSQNGGNNQRGGGR